MDRLVSEKTIFRRSKKVYSFLLGLLQILSRSAVGFMAESVETVPHVVRV
jgi:hypothetical protein